MERSTETTFFGKDFAIYVRDIRDEFNRIRELIANSRELLTDLRQTNDSLLNARQNEIIKRLTMISLIFSPIIFVAALFTIPAANVPIIESSTGWYGIFVFMAVVSAAIWWYFKKKRWV